MPDNQTRPVLIHLPVDLQGGITEIFEREIYVHLGVQFTNLTNHFITGATLNLPGLMSICMVGWDNDRMREIVVITPGYGEMAMTAEDFLQAYPQWRIAENPPLQPSHITEVRRRAEEGPNDSDASSES